MLGDAGALRTLVADAGFRSVEIIPVSVIARFPNPDLFLAGEIDVDTAAIPALQHLDATARQKLVAAIATEMADPLRELTEADHVVIPFQTHLVLARC